MSRVYTRPVPQIDPARPADALPLAGGRAWFTHVELISRTAVPQIVPASALSQTARDMLTAARSPVAGLDLASPRIMGILNVTPDSFSDGGDFSRMDAALVQARAMLRRDVDIIDIGGESTRPGAVDVSIPDEIARTAPVIEEIAGITDTPMSIDTRKSKVARAAIGAGAVMLNDVSAFSHDPAMLQVAAESGLPICLMHAQGDPATMQQDPVYDNVLLDVYDYLEDRINIACQNGIAREKIIVDPGIGFGKTLAHNLALLRRLSLFHMLGCPILLGASRKRFIGVIGKADEAKSRMPGSLAVALAALQQGVQIIRVHDVAETRQAFRLAMALG